MKILKDKEIWKDYPLNTKYQVSTFGNIRIKRKEGHWRYKKFGPYINLKPQYTKWGYQYIDISINGIKKRTTVHRLVLYTFKNINTELIVNHKDGIKDNNNLFNLEYTTYSENEKHAFKMGLKNSSHNYKYFTNLKEEDVVDIYKRYQRKEKQKDIAKIYNLSPQEINSIIKGRSWKHLYYLNTKETIKKENLNVGNK